MKIAVVNSRKPRTLHPDDSWLSWTMALGHALALRGDTLCTSVGTIGYDAALFGAAKGGGKIESFVPAREESQVCAAFPRDASQRNVVTRIIDAHDARRDQEVMNSADLVIAVAIRAGGHMETLLRERWSAGKNLRVVLPPDDEPTWRGTRNLANLGVPPIDEDLAVLARKTLALRAPVGPDELDWRLFFPAWRDEPLTTPTLAHYTRGASGPWPGQAYCDHLEDLWCGGQRARRDAPAALGRILRSSKLVASARLIRGRFPVVSFTAVSPDRIRELHRYRAHLGRWDFEPWGIVFDRDWLIKKQARSVRYLPSAAFDQLSRVERPWFQKHDPPACDYSGEEEWRVLGDVDFSDAPSDAVRLVLGS